MTQQSPAVVVSHPPEAILRFVNPMLKSLLRTPLMGGARKQLMVVSFSGRKTGRRYSVPVSAHQIDGQLYALVGAPWKRNFRNGTSADVLHDGKSTPMHGDLVEDPAAVAALYHRSAESYGAKTAQRMMGMKFRDQGVPTLEDFSEAVEREKLGAIRFTPAG
jgi:hypothetical protein